MALKVGDRVRVRDGIPAHELELLQCGKSFDDPAGMTGVVTYDGRKHPNHDGSDHWPIGVDLDEPAAGRFPRFYRITELEVA